jgi:hypothetical protein
MCLEQRIRFFSSRRRLIEIVVETLWGLWGDFMMSALRRYEDGQSLVDQ